jgi:hypothetical protein
MNKTSSVRCGDRLCTRKCGFPPVGNRLSFENLVEDFFDVFDVHKSDPALDTEGHFVLNVGSIPSRSNDCLDARSMSRQNLLAQATNGKHLPDQ